MSQPYIDAIGVGGGYVLREPTEGDTRISA